MLLTQHFLNIYAKKFHKKVHSVTQDAQHALLQYNWPGNVRELINAIEHGVALCTGQELDVEDLPPSISKSDDKLAELGKIESGTLAELEKNYILRVLQENSWNQKKACSILGLSKTTLYRRLKQYGIQPRLMTAPTAH